MARKILLKRWDGTSYDEVLPKTSTDQVIGLSEALGNKVDTASVGVANGVASLDSGGNVPLSQIPDVLVGSMKFEGTLASTDTWPYAGSTLPETGQGMYWIFTDNTTLTIPADAFYKSDEGERLLNPTQVSFQAGDWLIIIEGATQDHVLGGWSIVNNNQTDRYISKAGGTMAGNLNMGGNDLTNIERLESGSLQLEGTSGPELQGVTGSLFYGQDKVYTEGNEDEIDAGKLSGQDGAFYRNAGNLNAGIVPDARLSGTYNNVNIAGNAATANNLSGDTQITFNGDVEGSFLDTLGGQSVHTVTLDVKDNSHNHNPETIINNQSSTTYIPGDGVSLISVFSSLNTSLRDKNRTVLGSQEPSGVKRETGDLWFDTSN